MEEKMIPSKDGYLLCVHFFDVKNPKGVIKVIHGMEEHQERYEYLANYFNKEGYCVVTADMRGHGHTAPLLGFFKEKDGYKELIEDEKVLNQIIKERYNSDNVILLGHSMGTIISRVYLQTESKYYSKVILSGYPNYNPATPIAKFLCDFFKLFKGPEGKIKFMEDLTTGAFNKCVPNPRTKCDWLSYNEENVDTYLKDDLSGQPFTLSALKDLFTLIQLMNKKELYQNIKANLPVLLISGKDDPCTGGEEGRINSNKVLIEAGFKTTVVTFDKMRHEIFNEKEKDKVLDTILDFIEQ